MATTDRIADRVSETAGDARDQIRQLRDQVDSLMRERVTDVYKRQRPPASCRRRTRARSSWRSSCRMARRSRAAPK